MLSNSALQPTDLIVFNLLECSDLKSTEQKHIGLNKQELQVHGDSHRAPEPPDPISTFYFLWNLVFSGKQLDRKQMSLAVFERNNRSAAERRIKHA